MCVSVSWGWIVDTASAKVANTTMPCQLSTFNSSTSKIVLHALFVSSPNTIISPHTFIPYTGSKSPSASTTNFVLLLIPFSSTTSHHIFLTLSTFGHLVPPAHHPSSPFVVHQSSKPRYQTAAFPNSFPGFGKHFHQHSDFLLSLIPPHHPTNS